MILNKLLYLFNDGYTYGISMLIIGYYTLNKNSSNVSIFISTANGCCAIYGAITFLIYFREIFMAWYSQNSYNGYTFRNSRGDITAPFAWAFFGQLILLLFIDILFCFKKNRKRIWLSVFAIFVIKFSYFSEMFIIYSSLYKDYLPSSFSYYYASVFRDAILGLLFFIFLVGSIAFIKTKISVA